MCFYRENTHGKRKQLLKREQKLLRQGLAGFGAGTRVLRTVWPVMGCR